MEEAFLKEQFGDTGLLELSWKQLELTAYVLGHMKRKLGFADL